MPKRPVRSAASPSMVAAAMLESNPAIIKMNPVTLRARFDTARSSITALDRACRAAAIRAPAVGGGGGGEAGGEAESIPSCIGRFAVLYSDFQVALHGHFLSQLFKLHDAAAGGPAAFVNLSRHLDELRRIVRHTYRRSVGLFGGILLMLRGGLNTATGF